MVFEQQIGNVFDGAEDIVINLFFSTGEATLFLPGSTGLEEWWPIVLSTVLASGLTSIGIGLESDDIDDSLVVHQLVTLVVWKGEETVGFGVSDDLVRFDDLALARLFLRLLDFVEDVLAHDLVIQLGSALAVETEPTDLALEFAILGLVAIILRPSRHEFYDVVLGFKITGELAEVVFQRRVGLSRFLEIDDGVGVKIQPGWPKSSRAS